MVLPHIESLQMEISKARVMIQDLSEGKSREILMKNLDTLGSALIAELAAPRVDTLTITLGLMFQDAIEQESDPDYAWSVLEIWDAFRPFTMSEDARAIMILLMQQGYQTDPELVAVKQKNYKIWQVIDKDITGGIVSALERVLTEEDRTERTRLIRNDLANATDRMILHDRYEGYMHKSLIDKVAAVMKSISFTPPRNQDRLKKCILSITDHYEAAVEIRIKVGLFFKRQSYEEVMFLFSALGKEQLYNSLFRTMSPEIIEELKRLLNQQKEHYNGKGKAA